MRRLFVAALALLLWLPAFGVTLNGAGATFPYPLYREMFRRYHELYGVRVNYQAIGSGGGIRQLMARTVDFGASDAFVDDETMKRFPAPIVHIPVVAGAVVVTYNLPGNPVLRLTGSLVADIFLGEIKWWDDPRIKGINPSVSLPHMRIVVVHRSDGSGTTFIFSDYLCKVSRKWCKRVGRGKSLRWPVGLGAKGNPGVAGLVRRIPGAVGYVELTYAVSNGMPCALLKNRSGRFVEASVKSVTEASEVELPDDMRVSLTDTASAGGYPISGFTWILVYRDLADGKLSEEKAEALVRLLWWMIHDGQRMAPSLHYAPLSEAARRKAEAIVRSIQYRGRRLFR